MPSPTFTERRLYRQAAVLAAFQSAFDTPVTNFSSASSRAIWSRELEFDPAIGKGEFQGTTGTARKRREGRFFRDQLPTCRFLGGATPKNIEWFLRSWGGTWSGSPIMTLSLTEQINEFSTLGIVEKVPPGGGNGQDFIRIWDAWAHRIRFTMASGVSTLDAEASFAARDWDRTPLSSLGGIVLPPTFSPPAIDVFAPHQFRLYRDPAGANVSVAVSNLEIVLEHGLSHEPWNDEIPQVVKEGHTRIGVSFRSVWTDETKAIELDVETLPTVFKRFRAEWVSGSKNFAIDMKNVDFLASPTGWSGGRFREFSVEGEAYLDDDGNYVDFLLTP